MRTSLNEIREIERFVTKGMTPEASLVFQARAITDPRLRLNVQLQKQLMKVLQLFHRRKLKRNLQNVHQTLLLSADFDRQVQDIFTN